MSSLFHRRLSLALLLTVPTVAGAQTIAAVPQTTPVTMEQVYIANTTDQELVFFVETENTQRTEYRLAPGAARTLQGEPGDKWLNIEMQPGLNTVSGAGGASVTSTTR
jgi:hypothetical protein